MKWKEFLRDYFTFTRKERIGLVAIIVATVGIWIFPKVSRPASSRTFTADTDWITAAKRLMTSTKDSANDGQTSTGNIDDLTFDRPLGEHSRGPKGQLFNFDPNVLALEGWRRLGIPDKTISTIQHYLHKGGHFYKAEDLKKIYGIDTDDYTRLEPYIKIGPIKLATSSADEPEFKNETFPKGPKYRMVDINTADTSAFIALPGIGNKLALRIVNFREKLGGFYSIDQIGETYGLQDSSFQKIKPFLKLETSLVRKFNINSATKDEMKLHPYIKWNLANAIVEYRNQHGNFSSLEDLKKISLITSEAFEKVKFYLTL